MRKLSNIVDNLGGKKGAAVYVEHEKVIHFCFIAWSNELGEWQGSDDVS